MWEKQQSTPVPFSNCKECTLLGILSFLTVNLHALVCLETSGPPDPAALISHWGSLGKQAVLLILLGDGTLALEYSTGHYGAGTQWVRAHVDK